MITYNRADYTRMSLARLVETADEHTRLWLWHNGNDAETLAVAREFEPHFHRFHHSPENKKLAEPTNWLFQSSEGAYLSKVDDDCLMPEGWLATLRDAHEAEPRLGVVGCWRFLEEDFRPEAAARKIQDVAGGHRLMRHPWVEGSGYLMKRGCVEGAGGLRDGESFTDYCLRLALSGWINGWYFPFLWQEHLDDPRAPHSLLDDDEAFRSHLPLSAATFDTRSLAEWDARLRQSARELQESPWQAHHYVGWRRALRRLPRHFQRMLARLRGADRNGATR